MCRRTKVIDGFVFRREDKTKKDLFIRLIDFDNINNNIFKVVNQVEIQGKSELRIPDAIVYINGLPMVVIEFKSATRENATIFNAYEQLTVRYTRDKRINIHYGIIFFKLLKLRSQPIKNILQLF